MKQAISYHIPKMEFRDEGTKIIGRSTTVFGGGVLGRGLDTGKVRLLMTAEFNRDRISQGFLIYATSHFFFSASASPPLTNQTRQLIQNKKKNKKVKERK